MSDDARNSIKLWLGGIAFALLSWAALHFDFLSGVSDEWLWPVLGVVIGINIVRSIWIVRRRRSIKPGNLNG